MKKIVLGAALAAIVGAMSLSAQAADGTITITGEVTDSTCSIAPIGGGTGNNVTVNLGKFGQGALKAGSHTVAKPLSFKIVGGGSCTAGNATISFDPRNIDPSNGHLMNDAAGESNVQAQLLDANHNVIDLTKGHTVAIAAGDNNLTWFTRLFAKTDATVGEFNSTLEVNIQQN